VGDRYPQVTAGHVCSEGVADEEALDPSYGVKCLVEVRAAVGLRQDEPGLRPDEDRCDAVGREVRLQRQVHAAGLEDRQHGRHPVEVALHHDRDDPLPFQPLGEEGAGDPVGVRVELRIGE
jgi:hypothetical protein